jgi:hypothetical protein
MMGPMMTVHNPRRSLSPYKYFGSWSGVKSGIPLSPRRNQRVSSDSRVSRPICTQIPLKPGNTQNSHLSFALFRADKEGKMREEQLLCCDV